MFFFLQYILIIIIIIIIIIIVVVYCCSVTITSLLLLNNITAQNLKLQLRLQINGEKILNVYIFFHSDDDENS